MIFMYKIESRKRMAESHKIFKYTLPILDEMVYNCDTDGKFYTFHVEENYSFITSNDLEGYKEGRITRQKM